MTHFVSNYEYEFERKLSLAPWCELNSHLHILNLADLHYDQEGLKL